MSSSAADTLVVGFGNSLRSDDAAGLHVARRLKRVHRHVIETGELTPELAEQIARYRRVIFVDCRAGLSPGEIEITPVAPTERPDSHRHTPSDLVGLAHIVYQSRPEALLVGIGPATIELGDTLSPEAERGVAYAAGWIELNL